MAVDAVGSTQNFVPSDSLQAAQGAAVGSLDGMGVVCDDDPLASLQDSAEELTFARDNSRQTKLADRKQKSARALMEENLKRLQQVQQSVMQTENAEKHNLLNKLKEQNKVSAEEILKALSGFKSHCSSDYAFLLNAAEQELDPDFKALLEQAASQLFTEHEADIKAAANSLTALEGQDFAPALALSQTYSELAASRHEPADLLSYIEKQYGKENISSGIDAMFKALAADLAASSPSHETGLLNDLASSLGKTKTLHTSLRQTENFVDRLQRVHHFPIKDLKAGALLEDCLKLSTARFVTAPQVHQLYNKNVVLKDPEQEVLAAQELFSLLRTLPLELFDNLEARNRLVDGTQKLVDDLIDKEDAWIEAGGGE
ncbi:MAG: TyeA family type III secretion system gatekeeper subunit [Proteobacteria bacterium]|uniref:TyeA family type III secretion system gatekeeper subunit n=1 Tax=Candidatus Avisuccinivibrio stercorigallinarum TaxID=2840704 RepID=A0A9D9DCA6_9GAMM|nr:TyeA family type III secretion system gatekeeper subunit [Candidatus Avisuccinivibrio stercorigallinarum]